jgi:uncharacterized protein
VSTKTYIDTGFVVALVNERDQHHQKAAELASLHDDRQFLVTDAVLLEIGNALARKFRREAERIIEDFVWSEDVEVVRLTTDLFDEAFALYKAHADKEWGLTDCLSFVVMRQAGIRDALTFDQHFIQAGFRALMREDG